MASTTSAILVNYNGGDLNFACIDSLLKQPDVEVIFVDNASQDGSVDAVAARYGDRVRVLRLDENVGFARGCNAGARISCGSFLLFFNNDAIADPGMVAGLRRTLERHPELGIVGPVVLDARNPSIVQYTGPTIDRWGFTVDLTTDRPAASLPADEVRECFYISGCALMISANHFEALNGFDDGMFMFCEDVDLCWRSQLIGMRVATVRSVSCQHLGGGTATVGRRDGAYRTSAFRIVEREKNTFRMMAVNLNSGNLLRFMVFHYPFWLAEAFVALTMGKAWVAAAYWSGFAAAMRQLQDTFSRRKHVQATRAVQDAEILRRWSPRYEKLHFIRRVGLPKSA